MTILPKIWLIKKTKMSANWLLICVIGLILSSKFVSVIATPGDVCTAHSNCDGGEYCYNAGACSLCYDNNVCSIYGNSIDGDCSACISSSPSASDSSDNAVTNAEVTEIALGGYHSCAVLTDGKVKCWGKNDYGQLGDGATTDRTTPVDVSGITTATSLALGYSHSCALLTDGKVKCWGKNSNGQLGDGTTTDSTTPVDVSGITKATSVALGDDHSCALLTGGKVKCWGLNRHGELGDGTTIDSVVPVEVSGITTATSIALGGYHSCALQTGGSIKCWGNNPYGQIGDGTTSYSVTTPAEVSGIMTATNLALGPAHSCAVLTDGKVKCWGFNNVRQLGDGTTTDSTTPVEVSGITSATSIAMGGKHSCAMLTDGKVKCWGNNYYDQLGDGTMPILYSNQETITEGCSSFGCSPVEVLGITTATSIALGGRHSCAMLTDGKVKCWGKNSNGQLGDGITTERSTPVAVSGITTSSSGGSPSPSDSSSPGASDNATLAVTNSTPSHTPSLMIFLLTTFVCALFL